MREEYQKSIILVSMILIFGSLYGSSFFDRGSIRHNNIILFAILTAAVMIAYLQTKKIKEWKEDKKTDYILVYWSYFSFTIALFLYLIYMVVTRSELECMRLIKISMTHGMYKVYYHETSNFLYRRRRKQPHKLYGGSSLFQPSYYFNPHKIVQRSLVKFLYTHFVDAAIENSLLKKTFDT